MLSRTVVRVALAAAAFLAGLFVPDLRAANAPAPASIVTSPSGLDEDRVVAAPPPGLVSDDARITALDAHDPTALVMSSEPGGACPACECEEERPRARVMPAARPKSRPNK